jgi:hypothetical protein
MREDANQPMVPGLTDLSRNSLQGPGGSIESAPLSSSSSSDWAPRLAQEARLRALDDLIARSPRSDASIGNEIERASLLVAATTFWRLSILTPEARTAARANTG